MAYKYNTSNFGYLERKPVRELGNFLARQVVPKIQIGTQEMITHEGYHFFAFKWSDGLSVSALTDNDYPPRIIFELFAKIHDDFREKVPRQVWQNATTDCVAPYKKNLEQWISEYKNPLEFDAVSRVANKVEETKEILRKNIEQILGNREQVEKLLRESEDVSTQSEMMFKAAKKANKGCCRLQ